jgi:L,D-transpeptidase YcbB
MYKSKPVLALALLISVFSLFSCGESPQDEQPARKKKPFSWVRNIIGNFSQQDTIFLDSTYVDRFLTSYPAFSVYKKDIKKFYSGRQYALAWFDGDGLIEQAGNLYNRIQNIEYDAVEDKLPYSEKFEDLMNRRNKKKQREEIEMMLTSQYFSLANFVWKGLGERDSKLLGWYIPRKKMSYEAFLDTLLLKSNDEFLEDEPLNPQYEQLREHLKKYKEIQASWQAVTADKKSYKPGDSGTAIAQIRANLALLGDLEEDNKSTVYDAALEEGVRAFQSRHGLQPDGVIGKSMLNEMNVPISKRVDQLVVNMERTRWLPINYSNKQKYIVVNIPEYKLHLYRDDKPVWECNVVVGETENKTVIFTGSMKYVVFSPHWNVPESIVKDEIMPEMEKDPEYLEKQDLEIVDTKDGVPVIRQKPGIENSLGLVKFMFPNTHNIYLHDSPAKELFDDPTRAYSHGCIRVADPVRLAEYVLEDDPQWNSATITEAMHSGEEKYVTLKNHVPVFIVYFTSWVDASGKLNFRKDVYNNDSRLARMILESSEARQVVKR